MTAQRQRGPAARWLVVALAVAIATQFTAGVVGVVYLAGGGGLRTPLLAGPQGRPAPRISGDLPTFASAERVRRTAAVRALLGARSSALLHRDRVAFLAGIDRAGVAFYARQARLFDNLRDVPLGSWSYDVDPDHELIVPPQRVATFHAPVWAPQVSVNYRLAGFDSADTSGGQQFTFVKRVQGWYIGADDDFDAEGRKSARGLWDFGPVLASRTATTLVLGHPRSRRSLNTIRQVAEAAIPRVTAVWGRDWAGKVVVLVPDTQTELSRIIEDGTNLSQIAAVATAELTGNSGIPAGDRVIVNPPNFAKLGSLGRRVVLQHEITHVASRAFTTGVTPTWLAEGFADYVGYLGTGVPVEAAGHELVVDLRAGRAPRALPANADFGGGNARLAQVYEMSWLACRLIASLVGVTGLVRFYRAVGSAATTADGVDAALRSQLHLTRAQFTLRWRGYLAKQLA